MIRLEEDAKAFAAQAHGEIHHLRKYTLEPYICHPAAVAKLVRSVPHTPEMLAAAWLHDTVEDTPVTLEVIRVRFGESVAALVEMLTDISQPSDGNRKKRKAMDRAHTAQASPEAKTIKLADLIDNAHSIIMHDPKFAQVFIKEKAELLAVLQEGDPTLLARATTIASNYYSTSR